MKGRLVILSLLVVALSVIGAISSVQGDCDSGIRKEHLDTTAKAFVDDDTIEIDDVNGLQVKDGGITDAKMAANFTCKAWAYIAANGAINASYNVASVDHPSANGVYTINWDTDFSSANYAVIGNAASNNLVVSFSSLAAGSAQVNIYTEGYGTTAESAFFVAAFGAQ